jgi:hypothetical protein
MSVKRKVTVPEGSSCCTSHDHARRKNIRLLRPQRKRDRRTGERLRGITDRAGPPFPTCASESQGGREVTLYAKGRRHGAHPSPRPGPANGLAVGMTGLGHRHCALPRPARTHRIAWLTPKAGAQRFSPFGRSHLLSCLLTPRVGVPRGPRGRAPQEGHRHGARPRPQTAWLRGMRRWGHDHCALPRPLTEPQNRMVEPKSWGHSDFPFWAQ